VTLAGAPLSTLGLAFAGLGGALVALYVLKLRRRRVEVPFAGLWRRVLKDTESTALWRKLRRLVSLLVQLAVLALLLLAVGDPRLAASTRGRTLAIVVDTSASMQTLDAHGKSRLDQALEAARRLVRGLGAEDAAILVTMDGRPSPRTGLTGDQQELERALDRVRASDTPADVERALRLAGDALAGRPQPTLVLIGDGAWDPAALERAKKALPEADWRYLPTGETVENVAITAFAVRRYRANQTAYEVLVELQRFGDGKEPLACALELVQDGEVVNVEHLTLGPDERLERDYSNLAGEGTRLQARLKREGANAKTETLDRLAVDDVAYALLPPRKKIKVQLVTAGNLFLEGALLLDENLAVEKIAPAAWDAEKSANFDAVVLDGFTPREPPRTHTLWIDPHNGPGAGGEFALRGTVDSPIVTEIAAKHPVMRWVTLADLNVTRASRFSLESGDVAVASALHDPIVVARERGGRKQVALGFDIRKSDLPMRVAFPVLVVNALDWFAGADTGLMPSVPLGQAWRLPAPAGATEVEVRGPDGTRSTAPVHDGRATFYAARVGYYEVRSPGGAAPRLVAANLSNAAESRLTVKPQLTVAGRTLAAPEPGKLGVRRTLWSYLLVLALALVFIEWWTYNRRVTV
jgi:hypothetical protein